MDYTTIRKTRIETRNEIKITGAGLITLLNQELAAQGKGRPIPANATVVVGVPGGGDWSNTSLDIDERTPICIAWKTIETEEG